jgi:membrane fusion protein, adhesin transport system
VNASTLPVLRSVRTSSSLRRPAWALAWLLVALVVLLAVTPWQQNTQGEGRVIAFSPLDREQSIEAPVEGRAIRWHVQEGSVVREGDPIVDLADNDPELLGRMRSEREALRMRLDAASGRVRAIESRLIALEASREAAMRAAQMRVRMANSRVAAARKAVEASEAANKTARLNLDRQRALIEKGIVSTRAVELADLDVARASTDLERSQAADALARSEVLAIEADRIKVESDTAALLEDARATMASASSEVAGATAELTRIDTRLARQGNQEVKAPRDGTILRLAARQGGDMVKSGDVLAVLVPQTVARAVEVWIDGRDVPLVQPGGLARLQFEGWPALQFSGWPSVAVGSFGGHVAVIDATDNGKGKFRVVVVPDSTEPWPDNMYLRQGVRVQSWLLLGRVSLGYELWRQFNGFPPAMTSAPVTGSKESK